MAPKIGHLFHSPNILPFVPLVGSLAPYKATSLQNNMFVHYLGLLSNPISSMTMKFKMKLENKHVRA